MIIRYPFCSLREYIPSRYTGLSASQMQDRQTVYSFKDGRCSPALLSEFDSSIKKIVSKKPGEWVVCFIPASSQCRTNTRFGNFSRSIESSLNGTAHVAVDAIHVTQDTASGHLTGKNDDPTQYYAFNKDAFCGKNVILIDDVITRGRTFCDTADKLRAQGALSVFGLFVAKTIHPDLPIAPKSSRSYDWEYDENLEDFAELDPGYDEMMADIYAQEEFDQEMADEAMTDAYAQEEFDQEMADEAMQALYDQEEYEQDLKSECY